MDLAGKVALVTGGALRIGRAISLALAGRGVAVAIHYNRSAEPARGLVAEVEGRGGRAIALKADLSRPAEAEAVVRAAIEQLGRLDVVVNNAATFQRTPFPDAVSIDDWNIAIATNLTAPFVIARAAAAELKARSGKIVNLGDVAGDVPWPDYIPYAVSKAGLASLTKGLARALAPRVTVNALALGPILLPDDAPEARVRKQAQHLPLERLGRAEDVVAAVLFLLEGADWMTGAVIPVDGGRLTR